MKTEHSKYYIKTETDFNMAEEKFNAKPNKQTAKKLSDLRAVLTGIKNSEKYTKKYYDFLSAESKARREKGNLLLRNCLTTIKIENAYKHGRINNSTRIAQHEINDAVNPLNY